MWIAILIVSLILFILISFVWLPKIFLRVQYLGLNPYDNVIKEIDEKYTSATVYSCDGTGYIEKYALVRKNGYKEVVCKLKPVVKNIKYDLVLFSKNNLVLDILSISENITGNHYTKSIKIPNNVEKIMIVVKSANKKGIKGRFRKVYIKKGILPYLCITSLLFFALTVALQFSFINIFGDVYYQDIINSFMFLIVSFVSTILYGIFTKVILKFRKF